MLQLLLESDLNKVAFLTTAGCCDCQAGDYLSKLSPRGWDVTPFLPISLPEEVKSPCQFLLAGVPVMEGARTQV